ncbi:GvpL/GvpF family gas vesicle protein [Brachybacterium sp. FME24]|uniref:GvpL/GvpF family gas vesicle protein n=1 Tax=Brachybacterium sp. FME24 TaxID=2742605 RepID=UPI00186662EA|nr:GvpL/GvpF family gas vesicle protein [Brachybacterium sp. FME24]
MSEQALYVYAIAPSGEIRDPGTGIDGQDVLVIDGADGVCALAHRQGTTPYEGPDDDVRRWVLEHSGVIDRAWQAAGAVLPVSFNVIVAPGEQSPADEALQEWLHDNAGTIRERLTALTDHVELRIQIAVETDTVAADASEIARVTAEMASKPEGVQRLYRKKLETMRRDVSERVADSLYPEFRRRILQHAVDVVENRQSRTGEGMVPILDVAVLVAETEVELLGIELAEIRDSRPGLEIRFLGPWPPYSFADLPALTPGGPPQDA